MSVEKVVADTAVKATQNVEKGVEQFIKKAWSVMDAAVEKQKASEYLSDKGIKSIQGKGS